MWTSIFSRVRWPSSWVPISSLLRNARRWNIFAVDGDHARQVDVEIGHMSDEMAELLSGAKPSDHVVVHPSDTLDNGSLVERRD